MAVTVHGTCDAVLCLILASIIGRKSVGVTLGPEIKRCVNKSTRQLFTLCSFALFGDAFSELLDAATSSCYKFAALIPVNVLAPPISVFVTVIFRRPLFADAVLLGRSNTSGNAAPLAMLKACGM